MMLNDVPIDNVTADTILDYDVCGYKNIKREGYLEKVNWLRARFAEAS
jgi:hypothetical protein